MGESVDWKENLSQNSNHIYKKSEFGPDFVKDFKKTYTFFQHNTPHIAQGILHLLMGQLPSLKNMRIPVDANYLDTRIHIVWFQQSDTGKGRGFNFASAICDGIGLKYEPVFEITDAALLGGFDQIQKYDSTKKGYVTEYSFIPGLLQRGQTNILAMNEASVLFNSKPNQIQKNAMDYYQITMNTLGTKDNIIPKRVLHGGNITCEPDCSLFLTSYIPDKLNEVIATRGFASRPLNIINDVSIEDRRGAMDHSAEFFNVERNSAKVDLYSIIGKMKFINEFYAGVNKLEHDPSIKQPLRNFVSQVYDTTVDVGKFQRKKLIEFMHRYQDMGYKLMYHSCCLRLGKKIEADDVTYAESYLMPIWRLFITYLEESMVQSIRDRVMSSQIERDVYEGFNKFKSIVDEHNNIKFLDKDGFMPRPLLKKYLKIKVWKCSSTTVDKRLKDAEKTGLVEQGRRGMIPTIKILRKPDDPV